jgi:hypothetical protein
LAERLSPFLLVSQCFGQYLRDDIQAILDWRSY